MRLLTIIKHYIDRLIHQSITAHIFTEPIIVGISSLVYTEHGYNKSKITRSNFDLDTLTFSKKLSTM